MRTVVVLATTLLAGLQAVPKTGAIVESVARYVAAYQLEFVALVADETTHQRVFRGGATVPLERVTTGELFSTVLENGAWMSLHDIQVVDGQPVAAHEDVRSLLRTESMAGLTKRLANENARYNLGQVVRNFNEPTLALLLFTPTHVHNLSVNRGHVDSARGRAPIVTLELRLPSDAPLVRSGYRPVTTRGTAVVEADTGRVHETTVSFSTANLEARLDTTYRLEERLAIWVPVTFTEHYSQRFDGSRVANEVIEVETTLSNYRRYETSGRIVQ